MKEGPFYFLQKPVPIAEQVGLRMAIDPDDPLYSMLSLPGIVWTEKDVGVLLNAAALRANGRVLHRSFWCRGRYCFSDDVKTFW